MSTPTPTENSNDESALRTAFRWLLGLTLIATGTSHLTVARKEFKAQVPETAAAPRQLSYDKIVVWSGFVEIALGSSLIILKKYRKALGRIAAALFVAIFPGNIAQYIHRRNALGMDTDTKRFVRLLGQPLLVAWALWSTGALKGKPSGK